MTPDAILAEFGASDQIPEEALRAAAGQTAALAPAVIAAVERAAANVTLPPQQEGVVFFGLLVLAAARETALCQPLLRLLKLPEERLLPFFGFDPIPCQAGILVSVFDGDAASLLAAVEDRRITGDAKWALFAAAARLVWEGRVPRAPFLDLVDRFDRDAMALPDDIAWGGWQDAIRYLGLTQMADRVAAGWAAGRLDEPDEEEREIFAEGLAWSASHPQEPRAFDDDGIAPIDDPVAFLGAADLEDDEEAPDEPGAAADAGEPDPGEPDPEALDERHLDWLARFLDGPETSLSTMGLEMADGFLTALAIGPARLPRETWLAEIWGERGPPRFADEAQQDLVTGLLDRHAATIARRAAASRPPDPYVWADAAGERPLAWATGFLEGVALAEEAWRPLLEEPDADALLGPIEALADEDGDPEDGAFDQLPSALLAIQDYWRRPPRVPVRSTKVGRNDPCPCGSGKKYKKCHGANGA